MATAGSRIFNIIRSSGANLRRLSSSYPQKRFLKASLVGTGALCAGAGALVIYICRDIVRNPPKLPAVLAKEKEKDTKEQDDTLTPHLSKKEERFQEFASCEYDGQMFMTPQDFLESVTQEEPRARIGRVRLTEKEVTKMLHSTPTKRKASSKLFRQLNDKGIISYTEYVFLLCILTKPQGGFKIAFNMFDRDGNQKVDRQEFLVIEEIFGKKTDTDPSKSMGSEQSSLNFQFKPQSLEGPPKTTLMVHLFGHKGRDTLDFQTFYRFMDDLQVEVLELEFMEFSKGMNTISEEEFAEVLLKYTRAVDTEREDYIERLKTRIQQDKVEKTKQGQDRLAMQGINFKEFKDFFQFLNTLDDFSIAMRMYTIANQPISQSEFQRAVKISTGHDIAPHVVNTVFQIFDKDGDGKLSYKEFIGVMKDRVNRGFRYHLMKYEGWEGFKSCVKHEMKASA